MNKTSKAPVIRPPGCGLRLDKENAEFYGRRGGGSAIAYVYIDGRPWTYAQIATHTGYSKSTVEKKVKALRGAGKDITWTNLEHQSSNLK